MKKAECSIVVGSGSSNGRSRRDHIEHAATELRRSPLAQATAACLGLFCAGAYLRRPREGAMLGLASGLTIHVVASEAASSRRTARNTEDVAVVASHLDCPLPSLGTWAIEADFARLIAQEVEKGPGLIVEFGSGASTVLIASILKRLGRGKLISFDHDPGFATTTEARLEEITASEYVDLIVAPLADQEFGGTAVTWYDIDTVSAALPGDTIDLLIVDGPPNTEGSARWPAVNFLNPQLAPRAVVLADDGRRKPERLGAFKWSRDHPDLALYWLDTLKGTWRLEKQAHSPESPLTAAIRRIFRLLDPNPTGFDRWPVRR